MFKFFFESFGAESVSPPSFLFSFRVVSIRDSKQSLRFSFEYDIKRLFEILGSRWKPVVRCYSPSFQSLLSNR